VTSWACFSLFAVGPNEAARAGLVAVADLVESWEIVRVARDLYVRREDDSFGYPWSTSSGEAASGSMRSRPSGPTWPTAATPGSAPLRPQHGRPIRPIC
jgi:hypothetical protein